MRHMVRSLLLAGVSFGQLSACGGGGSAAPPAPAQSPQPTPTAKLALKPFAADCTDFLAYAADALTEQYLAPQFCAGLLPCPVFAAGPGVEGDAAAPPPAPAPDRVSQTNTQEAGVDEADIVKADAAGHLYVLSGSQLHALLAYPPEQLGEQLLTTLDLGAEGAYWPVDLILDTAAQRLVVLGSRYDGFRAQAEAIVFDLSAPLAPVEVARLRADGYPLEARRIGARIHRVSRFDVPLPDWFYDPQDVLVAQREAYQAAQARGDEAAAAAIKAQLRETIGARVDAAGADPLLPRIERQLAGQPATQEVIGCDAVAHPDVPAALGMAVIDSFDTAAGAHAASAVINNAYLVYASAQNLYLAQSSAGWFFAPAQTDQTAIYRLALNATGAASYAGVGVVDGWVGNRYQLSEHAGVLRVATTEQRLQGDTWQLSNHVFTLDAARSGDMPVLGAIRDLAPGETVQGARFVGGRGFVVTFRQVDPLFALDLADPRRPLIADELKIPGFSSYLMPLDDTHLLTIGRAGDDEQLTGGVAIQLFDVSNLRNIRQTAVLAPDAGNGSYSYSAAEYDPRAFSFFSDTTEAALPGTLSVPLQSYGSTGEAFAGFLLVRVDPDAAQPLAELGRIDHQALTRQQPDCLAPPGASDAPPTVCADPVGGAWPQRSVFMQDAAGTYLFTLSTAGIRASDAAHPAQTLGSLPLPWQGYWW